MWITLTKAVNNRELHHCEMCRPGVKFGKPRLFEATQEYSLHNALGIVHIHSGVLSIVIHRLCTGVERAG